VNEQRDSGEIGNTSQPEPFSSSAKSSLKANNRSLLTAALKGFFGILGCFGLVYLGIIALFFISSFNAAQQDKENRGESTTNYDIATAFLTNAQDFASEETSFKDWQVTTASAEMSMDCLGYMKPDAACYYMQSQVPASAAVTIDTACSEAIVLAKQLGASSDFVIGEANPTQIVTFDQMRCIQALADLTAHPQDQWSRAYAVKGVSDSGVPWALVLTARGGSTAETEYSITIGTDYENYFTSFKNE
jgi:hypothetical protein